MDNIYIHSKGETSKFLIKFIRLLNLRTCRRKNNNKLNNTAANKKALRNQYSQGFKNYFKKHRTNHYYILNTKAWRPLFLLYHLLLNFLLNFSAKSFNKLCSCNTLLLISPLAEKIINSLNCAVTNNTIFIYIIFINAHFLS